MSFHHRVSRARPASVAGQPGEEAALALVKMYNDLLERQLARRAELLAEEGG